MKMTAAVVLGFLAGILAMFLFHPTQRVQAWNPINPVTVHVREVPKGGDVDMKGSKAVGVSCFAAPPGQPVLWHCFVATEED
jgi:hypothetical protein